MKRFHQIIILASSTLFLGCGEFLDKQPLGEMSVESAFSTANDANKALVAAYNPLLNYNGMSGYSIYDIAADNAEKGGEGPSDGGYFNEIAYSTLTSTNTIAAQVWKSSFLGIRRANIVIEKVPHIAMDDNAKQRILAEGRFLRAFYYFNLVTLYGDVPLIDKAEEVEQNFERSSKELVYDLIIQDLTFASGILPEKANLAAGEKARATKGAAEAYLGKVYLYKGDFAQAEIWLKKVIDSKAYSLTPKYYDIFSTESDFGRENIFEVNYVYDAQFNNTTNLNQLRQGSTAMYGYGFANPTQDLVDAFEPGDPRKGHTVYKQNDIMPDGVTADVGISETGYMNKKAYLLQSEFPVTGDARHSGKNELLYRYGMLLLWHAEAANEVGKTQDALKSLNEVRIRAREGNNNILPLVTTTNKEELRRAIWQEQRVEYAMENIRYFDLIRQKRAGLVMRAYSLKYNSNKGKNFRDGINELFPIPQSEIDISQGKLKQNPGF